MSTEAFSPLTNDERATQGLEALVALTDGMASAEQQLFLAHVGLVALMMATEGLIVLGHTPDQVQSMLDVVAQQSREEVQAALRDANRDVN